MIRKGIGLASGENPQEVGRQAALRALAGNPKPQIGILFSSIRYDQPALFQAIRQETGRIPLFGTTSSLLISNRGVEQHAVLLLLLSSDDIDFRICAGKTGTEPSEVAKYLCSKYLFDHAPSPEDMVSCLITCPEKHARGWEYLKGMREVMPFPLPVSGGATVGFFPSDDYNLLHLGNQYCGDILGENFLSLLFLKTRKEGRVNFGYAYESSWEPIARPVTCTGAEGNVVMEVDGTPVLKYLRAYLGDQFESSIFYPSTRFAFIARLRDGTREKSIIRVPLHIDFGKGSLSFWPPENMQGQVIQLVQLSREDLLKGTTIAARNAREALGKYRPEVVLAFSCTTRSRLLHTHAYEEVERIREVFGDGVPIVGMYCNAEFSPLHNLYADVINSGNALCGSRQIGCSVSLFVLGSDDPVQDPTDYRKLLEGHFQEDVGKTPVSEREQICRLRDMLEQAEKTISENERILKYVIGEHYKANLAMQQKNDALSEANQRNEKLKEVIRQYTPHDVWKKASVSVFAGLYKIPDEEFNCSFVFMDVKGFTAFAEKHTPPEVISELNKIFRPATEAIYEHRGDIDKFIGDCIFAKFGEADDALRCSVAIQKMMRKRGAEGSPFSLRLGLNYGRIISGNVGASMRRENALIGDAVNLAQRMESACPLGSILATGEFVRQLSPALGSAIPWRSNRIRVKGKEEEIEVFEIPADLLENLVLPE